MEIIKAHKAHGLASWGVWGCPIVRHHLVVQCGLGDRVEACWVSGLQAYGFFCGPTVYGNYHVGVHEG